MSKNPPDLSKILDAAVQASKGAGKVLMHYFRGNIQVSEKKDAGLVTNADFEAQEKTIQILRKKFPHFGFLTEEEREKDENEGPETLGRWIIDPLDGTTNFVHGFPMFCVSIAAEWNQKIVAGAIYHPVLGDLYTAKLGQGAYLNGKKIQVSQTSLLKNALLSTGFTYRKDDHLKTEMKTFGKLNELTRAIRRPGSAALDLAYTACGVFDSFWERKLSPWDVAAGALIVMEAGGKVTDFQGNPFRMDSGEILATNTRLHRKILNQL